MKQVFKIKQGNKFVKRFTCSGANRANKECRLTEEEYKLQKYSLKAESAA